MKQNTFIYKTFAKVLKLDENKTKLLKLTAGTLKKLSKNQQKIRVIDWLETTILSNQKDRTITISIWETDGFQSRRTCRYYCPFDILMLLSFGSSLKKEKNANGCQFIPMPKF